MRENYEPLMIAQYSTNPFSFQVMQSVETTANYAGLTISITWMPPSSTSLFMLLSSVDNPRPILLGLSALSFRDLMAMETLSNLPKLDVSVSGNMIGSSQSAASNHTYPEVW